MGLCQNDGEDKNIREQESETKEDQKSGILYNRIFRMKKDVEQKQILIGIMEAPSCM